MRNRSFDRCANGSWPTLWSRTSRSRSRSSLAAALIALFVLTSSASGATAPALSPIASRDGKVIKRWSLSGTPHGVTIGSDGTIYVGLAGPQAIAAIDPKKGAITKSVVLDSPDIASTKELVSVRTDAKRERLLIANGSDESVTILSIPSLAVLREITLEGEPVRDVIAEPSGKHLFVLGRDVHVFDAAGQTKLRTLDVEDPMAIALSESGSVLAVVGTQDFGNATATVAALFDAASLAEIDRSPLQTQQRIEAAMFAAGDRALVAVSRDTLFEKPLDRKAAPKPMQQSGKTMRMAIDFGDLVSSEKICLPEGAGPQILARGNPSDIAFLAERRCSASGTFSGSNRRVTPASLYGVGAYALAVDTSAGALVVTDSAGFLTLYRLPRVALAK
jgi:hypothetical protein